MEYKEFRKRLDLVISKESDLNKLPLEDILKVIPTVDKLSNIQSGDTVLVRADLDMPIKDGKVADLARINACTPTIKYCIEQGWKTLLFGHLGRDPNISIAPVCEAVSEAINHPVELIEDWLDDTESRLNDDFVKRVKSADSDTVFMLQNTRKYDIERGLWKPDREDLQQVTEQMYAVCSDIRDRLTSNEINEGIAASNTDFSSSVLPLVMSKTALGFYISEEFRTYIRPARQANLVIFSGLKINKLDDLENVVRRGRLKMIISAGSLAMALRKAMAQLSGDDFFIGLAETDSSIKAYIDNKRIEQGKRIIQLCREQGIDLVLPVDFVLDSGEVSETIPEGRLQMDIGPKSRDLVAGKIRDYIEKSRKSKAKWAAFYNGVFGKFEDDKFAEGTKSFIPHLKEMTDAGIETFVGGGEGRLALARFGSLDDVTHAFTCGGTVLKSLTDYHISYLKAMYVQNTRS